MLITILSGNQALLFPPAGLQVPSSVCAEQLTRLSLALRKAMEK